MKRQSSKAIAGQQAKRRKFARQGAIIKALRARRNLREQPNRNASNDWVEEDSVMEAEPAAVVDEPQHANNDDRERRQQFEGFGQEELFPVQNERDKSDGEGDGDFQPLISSTMKRGVSAEARTAMSENKRVVATDKSGNWTFVSPDTINDTSNVRVIPLIREKWGTSSLAMEFKESLNPMERAYDWSNYAADLNRAIEWRGEASQWQRALYVTTNVGEAVRAHINEHAWMSPQPVEGVKHYDDLLKNIHDYYKTTQDPDMALNQFTEAKQGKAEGMMKYWERLQKLRRMCGIAEDSPLVKQYLVKGAKDNRIREHNLTAAAPYTTWGLVQLGIKLEASDAAKLAEKQKNPKDGSVAVEAANVEPVVAAVNAVEQGDQQSAQYDKNRQEMQGGDPFMRRRMEETRGRGQRQNWGNRDNNGGREQRDGRNDRGNSGSGGGCRSCGLDHGRSDRCGASETYCYRCQKRGHYARVCKGGTKVGRNAYNSK